MMYKLGQDTNAVMMLLLHAASRYSLEGVGNVRLPAWYKEESQLPQLLADLRTMTLRTTDKVLLTDADIATLQPRVALKLIAGIVSGNNPTRLLVPSASTGYTWNDVSYRLTIGWQRPSDVPAGGASPPALALAPCLERFEIAGPACAGQPEQTIVPVCRRTLTLFFNEPDDVSSCLLYTSPSPRDRG